MVSIDRTFEYRNNLFHEYSKTQGAKTYHEELAVALGFFVAHATTEQLQIIKKRIEEAKNGSI